MKLKFARCLICLSWYSPNAHHEHCPYCGAYPLKGNRHCAFSLAGDKLRELISGVYIPIALRSMRHAR